MTATSRRSQWIVAAPCAKCPWRAKYKGDDDYLRAGRRAGIARGLLEGSGFPCHETVEHDDAEDYGEAHGLGVECAGAALVMLRAEREPQLLRIAERLGEFDPEAFLARHEDVELWTLREALDELHDDEPEGEPCHVSDSGCEAPAGWLVGGEVVNGDTPADGECPSCGLPVCGSCSDDDGVCVLCEEDDDE